MHSTIRRSVLVIAFLLLSAAARSAPPSDPPVVHRTLLRFEWVGSPSCRPELDVLEGLRRLIGADPNEILAQQFTIRAGVQQLSNGWMLTLSSKESNGIAERQLIAPTCTEVAQAASLVISLWIQPASTKVLDGPESGAPTHAPGNAHQLTEIEGTTPSSGRAIRSSSQLRLRRLGFIAGPGRNVHGQLAVGVTAFSGAVPSWSWGMIGRVGVALGAWHVDGQVLWLDNRQSWAPAEQPLGGEFGLVAAGVRVAYALPVARFLNIEPGIWSLIGRLRGSGLGTMTRYTPSNDEWGAAGLGVEASMSIGHLVLSLGGGNGLPFGRPRFFVGDRLLYQTPPVIWFGHVLGGIAFP